MVGRFRRRHQSLVKDEDTCRLRLGYGSPAPYGRLVMLGAIGLPSSYKNTGRAAETAGPPTQGK